MPRVRYRGSAPRPGAAVLHSLADAPGTPGLGPEHLRRHLAMQLGDVGQTLLAVSCHAGARGLHHVGRAAQRQLAGRRFSRALHPLHEAVAREDRGRRHGHIALRAGPLLELHGHVPLAEGALEHPLVGELIAQRPRAGRHLLVQCRDDASVAPSQQAVEVAELGVKLIVAVRAHADNLPGHPGQRTDFLRHGVNASIVADLLAVAAADLEQRRRRALIGEHAGHHQRAEIIALAALIHPEVGGGVEQSLALRRRMQHPLAGVHQHHELQKLVRPRPLHQQAAALRVIGDIDPRSLEAEEGVLALAGFVARALLQLFLQGGGIVGGELNRVLVGHRETSFA